MKICLALLILVLLPLTGMAATLVVTPDGDGDYATIQAALDAADSGDIILLDPGTYRGEGNRDLGCQGKSLTIRSGGMSAADCVIDCGGGPGDPHRAFHFQGRGDTNVEIHGLTVTGGYTEGAWPGDAGGGILCSDGASPLIENCIFMENRSGNGGGLCAMNGSSPTLLGCVFKGNEAVYYGGGIYCYDRSAPRIEDCHVDANSAGYYGGGMRCSNSAPVVINSTFCRNAAVYGGAGLAFSGDSQAELEFCTLAENETGGDGGGIYCYYASPRLSNTLVAFNRAEGIFLYGQAEPQLIRCDLYGNDRGDWAGGLTNQLGLDGNLHEDPQFCGVQDPGEYYIQSDSPCAPGSSLSGDGIGAWTVGCENFAAESISWSELKALH